MTAVADGIRLPDASVHIRPLSNDDSSRLHARFPNLPASPRRCPTCGGSGWFRWYLPDGGVGIWECNCVAQWLLQRNLLHAGIGDHYARMNWLDAYGADSQAVNVVRDYIVSADLYASQGVGLFLHGPIGSGKTLLSTLLLREMLDRGYTGQFVAAEQLLDLNSAGWSDPEAREWFIRRVRNVQILVLDDLGRERMLGGKSSEYVESLIDGVLRHRNAHNLATVITTNYDPDALGRRYGGHVRSLLAEKMIVCQVQGEDFRSQWEQTAQRERADRVKRPIALYG